MKTVFMLSQIPPEIAALLSTKTLIWATAGWVLLQNVGRAYHAIVAGGGFVSIYKALLYGTNTPTPKEAVAEEVRKEQE